MGMYTEFHFNVRLKQNIPDKILNILRYMVSNEPNKYDFKPKEIPDHLLFKNSERWHWMLWVDSYYFAADTISTLRVDDTAKQYFLCVRCNLKNYDNEIENFIDWINPYIDAKSNAFLGFSRYEESEDPEIIRKK
jgi:hypothetical protein